MTNPPSAAPGVADPLQTALDNYLDSHIAGKGTVIMAREREAVRQAALLAGAADFDVRTIMLDVVPGDDGMGHEVYATSVKDVVDKLSDMGQRLENYELGITTAHPPLPVRAPEGLTEMAVGDSLQAWYAMRGYSDLERMRAALETFVKANQPTPPTESHMPTYGRFGWNALRDAVAEATVGSGRADVDETSHIGHQIVTLNYNSLNRIVSKFAATPVSAVPVEMWAHTGDNDVSTDTLLDESATMLEDYALHQRYLGNDSTAAGADAHAYRLRHLNAVPVSGEVQVDAAREDDYPEPLSNFREGQWWVKELDALRESGTLTADQQRAVATVHHLLKAAAIASHQAGGGA